MKTQQPLDDWLPARGEAWEQTEPEKPGRTLIVHVKAGCIAQVVSNFADVEILVLDSDTQDEQTPTLKPFGRVGWDWPEVEVKPALVARTLAKLSRHQHRLKSKNTPLD